MKRLLIMMMLTPMVLISLTGCNSIEDDAKRQMEYCIKELAHNPNSVDISDVRIVFSTDSCVVIQCTLEAENHIGALGRYYMEYVYAIDTKCKRESVKELVRQKSLLSIVEEILAANHGPLIEQYGSRDKCLERLLITGTIVDGQKIER